MRSAPTPDIESQRRFTMLPSIWIVPLLALLITGWMLYRHYAKLGSEVRIDFPASDGLIPGESVVRFRDVTVGTIVRITLQKGGDGVSIFVRMNTEAEPYLNASTRFWIVSPQFDSGGVRGLDTLLHGAYIAMSATRKGKLITAFAGLTKPYRGEEEGHYYHLRTRQAGNVHVGAAVYYGNLRAGSIDTIELAPDRQSVDITIFIQKKYTDLINTTTRFWHQDLVAVNMEGGQIALDLAPAASLLFGSIRFASKLDRPYPKPAPDYRFRLYDKHRDAIRRKIGGVVTRPTRFGFAFSGHINGLHEGAPIRYQGFDVGEVNRVTVHYNPGIHAMDADVLGTIDTSIFDHGDRDGAANLYAAVCAGLHAALKSDNPFTPSLYVDLLADPDQNASQKHCWVTEGNITQFPTRKKTQPTLLARLDHLLASLSALTDENRRPLLQLLAELDASAKHLNALMAKPSFQSLTDDLNQTLGSLGGLMDKNGKIDRALTALQKTLKTTKNVMRGYGTGSLFGRKLDAMIKEVGRTSEETKRLIEKLNKKPNALIFGD